MVTFFFYCVVLPLTILVPEVYVPIWGAVYIPSIITILNSVGTPRSGVLCNAFLHMLHVSSSFEQKKLKHSSSTLQVNSPFILLDPF